jgi:hypothetical protein
MQMSAFFHNCANMGAFLSNQLKFFNKNRLFRVFYTLFVSK